MFPHSWFTGSPDAFTANSDPKLIAGTLFPDNDPFLDTVYLPGPGVWPKSQVLARLTMET